VYEKLMDEVLAGMTPGIHPLAVELAALPQQIRGFGHIKMRNLEAAKSREAELLDAFRNPAPTAEAAE
jgi:indolepyruvate ferredoxin oxidoreductase